MIDDDTIHVFLVVAFFFLFIANFRNYNIASLIITVVEFLLLLAFINIIFFLSVFRFV